MNREPRILNTGIPRRRAWVPLWRRGLVVLLPVLLHQDSRVYAQPDGANTKGSNYTLSDYYPAPNHTQKKYQLTGAQGRLQPGTEERPAPGEKGSLAKSKLLLTDVKLQTFRLSGELEMIVETPECIYEIANRKVSSAGRLTVASGDGTLRVEGDGFACQMEDKSLVISNNVRATVQETNSAAGPLVVTSRWFEFVEGNRRGVFHDNVRGEDAALQFACGQLSLSGSTNQSSFDLIEADGSLEITGKAGGPQAGRRASAQRGLYRQAKKQVELFKDATWQMGEHSGKADQVTARQGDGSFEAVGHVALKAPRAMLGAAGGLLTASNAPTAAAENLSPVNLFADYFRYQSNLVVATGGVRVADGTNQLSCDRLESNSTATNSPDQRAVATGHVIVARGDGNMHADRADFTKSDGVIVFTGNPGWQQSPVEGRAERVTFKTASGEVEADNKVAVKIQLGASGGSLLKFFPQAETNQTEQVVEISARTLRVKERQAVFAGNVQTHQLPQNGSESRLQSEVLEVRFATNGSGVENIMAAGNVMYEQGIVGVTNGPAIYRKLTCRTMTAQGDPKSGELSELVADGNVRIEQPGSEARGDKMVYNRATEILKLMGQPVIEAPQATYTSQQELIWDRARGTVSGKDYRITAKPEFNSEALKRATNSQKITP